jgi:hypothetical protein
MSARAYRRRPTHVHHRDQWGTPDRLARHPKRTATVSAPVAREEGTPALPGASAFAALLTALCTGAGSSAAAASVTTTAAAAPVVAAAAASAARPAAGDAGTSAAPATHPAGGCLCGCR